jgi:polysaccharide export outer membrane protein
MESSEHNGKSKIIFVILSLLVAVSILPLGQFYLYSQETQDTIKEQEYHIGIGDVLDISLWQIPDLSKPDVIVRPDGKISLPLISDVQAAGLTLTQLDEEITQRYTAYVRNPEVSVMIRNFGGGKVIGNKVIVLGDVASPGVYSFTGDIRIVEALALAGDCTKYAVRNNVLIIRGDIHNNPTVISANILAFLKDAKLSENVLIQPQDVIFVPRSLIGNINTFLQEIAPIIDAAYRAETFNNR